MQKIFIKHTIAILTASIFLILFINYLFSRHMLENQQLTKFDIKIEQIIHTLESNQAELEMMNENLNEDYLTRAKAAAYVLDREEESEMDVAQMQYLAKLLNVDEVHYIDENGIIVLASVSKYIGMDMADHEQTSAFLVLLDNKGEDAYLIQDVRPNASEGKIMQYIGVARKEHGGFVQVGIEPKRLMEAQSRNTYDYIFSRFPTDEREEFFVVDRETGAVLGHSGSMEQSFTEECYQLEQLMQCRNGAYKKGKDGRQMYTVSRIYENVLICAVLPEEVLLRKLFDNAVRTLIYLLCVELAVILLLGYLVRRKVVDGIHRIIESLSAITDGNLDTTVDVGGNHEFEELSKGINTMVRSIINISNRTFAIIDMSGIPLAAYEYERGSEHVFSTSRLGELLDISKTRVADLCRSAERFDKFIQWMTKNPMEGESDVYRINDSKYVRIHMSESPQGKLGVITDVTADIEEKTQMRYENTHDPLTELYKYGHFQKLAQELLHKMPEGTVSAVVMLDLDYFKGINDAFGHDVGDKYLQGFAAVMRAMPAEHFLTSRRSGDEFCMMIYNCADRNEVAAYLDRFYETLAENPVAMSESLTRRISASAGYACTSDANADVAQLLSRADEALYETKNKIKGTYGAYND
ncbi:MAG: sensor domain-containing diguanylate cyclase [Lachnospiraceae bacterium]|nr:sensor domain-containing diguanylate cyclase [Lachnospiraceae bacterium]